MLPLKEEIKKIPFLLALIPFIVGVMLQDAITISASVIFPILVICLIICVALGSFTKFKRRVSLFLFLFIAFSFTLSGMFAVSIKQQNDYVEPGLFTSDAIIGVVADLPVKNASFQSVDFEIQSYRQAGLWRKSKTLCKLSIKGEIQSDLLPGTKYLIKAQCQRPKPPILPNQFDYSKYLYYKSIQTTCFIAEKEMIRLGHETNSIASKINNLRVKVLRLTSTSELPYREKAVLASLVFGFRGDIDPELQNAYSHAGVTHILSVSGMHVGIVFMFLMFLLKFLSRNPATRTVRSIIVIVGLWFYALLTGFSPPCARSALMFTFFALADLSNRNQQSMNTLAGSAIVLLLINPYNLFDTGFQLSYAAMIGIFLIYVPLNKRLRYKNWFLKYVLQLAFVSIAAQLATLPLSLYYFHQFPSYFLLANLLVVPASGLIIYTGLAYILLSPLPILAHWVAIPLKYLLLGLNGFVEIIDKMPASILGPLYITEFQVIAIIVIIIFIIIIVLRNEIQYLPVLLFSILSLNCLFVFQYIDNENAGDVKEYRFKGKTAIVISKAEDAVVIADSGFYFFFVKNSRYTHAVLVDSNKPKWQDKVLRNIQIHVGGNNQILAKTTDFMVGLNATHKKNIPYSVIWLKKVNSKGDNIDEMNTSMLENRIVQITTSVKAFLK